MWIILILMFLFFYIAYRKSLIPFRSFFGNDTSSIFYKGKYITVVSTDALRETVIERLKYAQDVIDVLVNYCVNNDYPTRKIADKMQHRWHLISLKEILQDDTHVAYLIDKTVEIRLCVRQHFNVGDLESINTMVFVILHELGHVMSDGYDHDQEFIDNFMKILRLAVFLDIYTPVHYSHHPVTYCNTEIHSSPCNEDY